MPDVSEAQMVTTLPDPVETLEDQGYRITMPRRSVIAALESKSDGFTVEQICGEVPGVGRATVYRTIKILLENGILCKLATLDGAPVYSLARAEHHHHIMCVQCGSVTEFRDSTIERLLRNIGADIDGEILGHRMEFYVRCGTCLSLRPTPS